MLKGYVKLTYICWTTNQIYIVIIFSKFSIRKDTEVGNTLASSTRGPRFESLAQHLTEFFFLLVYYNAPFCEQQCTHGSCYIFLFKFKSFDQFNPPELPEILDIYSVVAL